MLRAALYRRKSDKEKANESPLETQHLHLIEWCARHGYEVAGDYVDSDCRNTVPLLKREAGARLLRDAARGKFDVVLVYRLDRWSRRQVVSHEGFRLLHKYNVGFQSISETFEFVTPAGRAMLDMLLVFAELESDTIEQRCSDGMNRRARANGYLGGVNKYGYRVVDKIRVPDREPLPGFQLSEADVVTMIFTWYVEERLGSNRIAARLHQMGVPTPVQTGATEGKHRKNWKATRGFWQPETVRSILFDPIYTGTTAYGKTKAVSEGKRVSVPVEQQIKQTVEPIISIELFAAAQQRRAENRTLRHPPTQTPYLLSGKIQCAHCGHRYIGRVITGGREKRHVYYVCSGRHQAKRVYGPGAAPCPSPYVRAPDIEADLWETVERHIRNADDTLHLLREKQQTQGQQQFSLIEVRDGLRRTLDQKEAARRRTVDLMADGILETADGRDKLRRLQEERAAIEERLVNLDAQAALLTVQQGRLSEAAAFLCNWERNLDLRFTWEDKRRCVETFVDRITIRGEAGETVARYVLCFAPEEVRIGIPAGGSAVSNTALAVR